MADLKSYKLSMTGPEADSGIRTGMEAGATSGVLLGDGQGGVRAASPGVDYGLPVLKGNGPPTANTAANIGQHYFDMAAGQPPYEYICVGLTVDGFVWRVFGDTGDGFKISGYFADFSALLNAVEAGVIPQPEDGTAYGIGTQPPYDIYVWDALHQQWVNNGPLSASSGTGLPPHGANGEALIKNSDIDYDASWKAVAVAGNGAPDKNTPAAFAGAVYLDVEAQPNEAWLCSGFDAVVSGAIASFDDGADGIPVKSLLVDIEPVQAGSGDPSPENVRPISSWTGVKVQRAGKNLANPSLYTDNKYQNWNGSIVTNERFWISGFQPVKPNSAYIVSPAPDGDFVTLYTAERVLINSVTNIKGFTTTEETAYVVWHYAKEALAFSGNTQLELGSTATAYEPYQGDTYDISFPDEAGTVYGGTLDVTNGQLTVDRAMVDMGTMTWATKDTQLQGKKLYQSPSIVDVVQPSSGNTIAQPILCDRYQTDTWANVNDMPGFPSTICLGWNANGYIVVNDPTHPDLPSFVESLTDAKLVYPLATPLTYQLTPTEVKTLLGMNNIHADTGMVSVTYRGTTPGNVPQWVPILAPSSVRLDTISDFAFDAAPVKGSRKIITSGGVAEALANFTGDVEMVKLWENASPTSSFPPQTIPIDLSLYSTFRVVYKFNVSGNICFIAAHIPNTSSAAYYILFNDNDNNTGQELTISRRLTSSASDVSYGNCYYKIENNTANVDNNRAVPIAIYGIKGVT